ncbi:MAG: hypothetical protein ACJA09_001193 [Alcanivorax sp.]|jgi:hypothetical protein
MPAAAACQFKVWAFLKRNMALLSHDEYRAGHVGFHCGNTRRLKAIRGYAVNIHNEDTGLSAALAEVSGAHVRSEPAAFLSLWDGFPAVHFDSWEQWTQAGTLEPSRATAEGLAIDVDWTLTDGPHLFDRISPDTTQFRSYHTRVEEHVVEPVLRGETRPYKLLQFFRASAVLSAEEFRARVLADYAPLLATLAHLNGMVSNFRDSDIDAAVRGYYPDDHWCFSAEGRVQRQEFFDLWDGANELFFHSAQEFVAARRNHGAAERLSELEEELFDAIWYVAVDENVIVMPNRHKTPDFYYR